MYTDFFMLSNIVCVCAKNANETPSQQNHFSSNLFQAEREYRVFSQMVFVCK